MRKTKVTYGKVFRNYLNKGVKLERYQKIGVGFLVWVFAGMVGWIYEVILVAVMHGQFYMKGGNILPWMNIYAIGALLVIPVVYKMRRYPWVVFVVAAFVTGTVELIGGYLVYTVGNGLRYWDYTNEPWGIGNINGFVCPASAAVFGLGSLLLMYWLLPFCIYLAQKMTRRAFLTFSISLFAIIMVDELTNLTLKNLDLPTAMDFYRAVGFRYL